MTNENYIHYLTNWVIKFLIRQNLSWILEKSKVKSSENTVCGRPGRDLNPTRDGPIERSRETEKS